MMQFIYETTKSKLANSIHIKSAAIIIAENGQRPNFLPVYAEPGRCKTFLELPLVQEKSLSIK